MLRCLAKPNSSSSASQPGLSPQCPAWLWKPPKVWWKAVPASLSSERPDNNPPPPSISAPGTSRTKAAPVEVEPSCFTWITDRFPLPLFCTQAHTPFLSERRCCVSICLGWGQCLLLIQQYWCLWMLLINKGFHQILPRLNNNAEIKKKIFFKESILHWKPAAINWLKAQPFFLLLSLLQASGCWVQLM